MARFRHEPKHIGFPTLILVAAFSSAYWGIELLNLESVKAHTTRDYAWGSRASGGYIGGFARFETAIPEVRDGDQGFSSEVLWITTSGDNCPGIEVGWRTTQANPSPRWYWGTLDSNCNWNSGWISGTPDIGVAYDYEIVRTSGSSWDIKINGVTKKTVNVGFSVADIVQAGGEVTKLNPSVHNAMGVSGFLDLRYKTTSGWFSWGANWPFNPYHVDTGYTYVSILNNTGFQNYGYND